MQKYLWCLVACVLVHSEATPAKERPLSAVEELGKTLYFDPRLSVDGTVSCNSCHNVLSAGGDDSRAVSMGIRGQLGKRSSPPVFNAKFMSVQFWDGRAPNLEEQAKGPMTNPIEMGNKDHNQVVSRLKDIPGYAALFKAAFGREDALNIDNAAKAIAAYEKTLVTTNSAFDRYLAGEKKALSAEALKGYETFKTVNCVMCHQGKHFNGPDSLPEGQGFFMKFPLTEGTEYDKKYKFTNDLGRFEVTKKPEDKHFFRVATLRNVANTAPYFHNGAVQSLDEAVRVMAKTQLNRDLKDDEVKSIVLFLNSLSGTVAPQTMPRLPGTPGRTVVDLN